MPGLITPSKNCYYITSSKLVRRDSVKHGITWSGFAGIGYDIFLSDNTAKQQWILTPFLETTYMVSQRGVDLEDQAAFDDVARATVTIRAGISAPLATPRSRTKWRLLLRQQHRNSSA
ncbi:MAG: hypothetical protein IPF79_06200 [Ignavibacteria bacterium]|nr:hypothetical protein [Ignavibacteria bacterium]